MHPLERDEAVRLDRALAFAQALLESRALEEAERFADELRSVGAREVIALDAAAYFSRPGPRLVDGLETLAHALHPDLVPEAPGEVREVQVS